MIHLREDAGRVLRYTRNWLHYGVTAVVILLALVAAVEGLAGQ